MGRDEMQSSALNILDVPMDVQAELPIISQISGL